MEQETENFESILNTVPVDILFTLLHYCDPKTVLNLSATCHKWRNLCDDFWQSQGIRKDSGQKVLITLFYILACSLLRCRNFGG